MSDEYQARITCRMMPNQVEGVYRGRQFYFRARHGGWQLYRMHDGETEASPVVEGEHARAGWWEPDEFVPFCEALVRQHI